MKKLTLGKILNKDLADWFGISASRLSRIEIKRKYLFILDQYAKFRLIESGRGTTIYIDEIYEDTYQGEKGSPAKQRVKELVQQNWSKSGLDSCARVAKTNYPILQSEGYAITETTNYNYTCKGRTELWGSPMKRTTGELGSCHYEYGRVMPNGEIIALTEEQQKIKNRLVKKYFGDLQEWTLGVIDDLKHSRITEEEAGQALRNLNSRGEYLAWKTELETTLGFPIAKGTRVANETHFET